MISAMVMVRDIGNLRVGVVNFCGVTVGWIMKSDEGFAGIITAVNEEDAVMETGDADGSYLMVWGIR